MPPPLMAAVEAAPGRQLQPVAPPSQRARSQHLLLIFALAVRMLEVKAQSEHMLGKHSSTELYSKPKAFLFGGRGKACMLGGGW